MVHGACSSAGCFSMTDEQIAEIYAIVREAFGGGQRAIQMQSFPFRMTAENLAKHRLDPNMAFWKELKEGSDRFEVTRQETPVTFCNRRYVFNVPANPAARFDAQSACPVMQDQSEVAELVAKKQKQDEKDVAQLVANGVRPVRLVYQDGGQHPDFMTRAGEVSRPEALAQGPIEVPLDEPNLGAKSSANRLAVAQKNNESSFVSRVSPQLENKRVVEPVTAQPSGSAKADDQPFYKKLFDLLPGS
jgi:hypothetical protein